MKTVRYDDFSNNTTLDSIVIVGFHLFPAFEMKLDPVFSTISGKNGVGKTTLLDAIQIAIIANQNYIKLNIASARQDERTIGDYLMSPYAFIALNINHFAKIKSFGVFLRKQPDGKVQIDPFVFMGDDYLHCEDFLEEDKIITNLRHLEKNTLSKNGSIQTFKNIGEYHQFLTNHRIINLDLARKLSTFSQIYMAATSGLLRREKGYLKEILAPPKSINLKNLQALEQSFIEREKIRQKREEIREVKNDLQNIKTHYENLDETASKYFSTEYAHLLFKKEAISKRIEELEIEIEKVQQTIDQLGQKQDSLEQKKKELSKERDALLRETRDIHQLKKIFEEYRSLKKELTSLQEEMKQVSQNLEDINLEIENLQNTYESQKETITKLDKKSTLLQNEISNLEEKFRIYNTFRDKLEKIEEILNKKFGNFHQFRKFLEDWENWNKEIAGIEFVSLKIKQIHEKTEKRKYILRCASALKEAGFSFETVDQLNQILEEIENQLEKLYNLKNEQGKLLDKLRDELLKIQAGKLILPEAFQTVEHKAVFKKFEDVSPEESLELQAKLGPLTNAIELDNIDEIKNISTGKERLYFVHDIKNLMENSKIYPLKEGIIVEENSKWRYEPYPEYPLLGKKARQQRMLQLQEEINILDKEIIHYGEKIQQLGSLQNFTQEVIRSFDLYQESNLAEEQIKLEKELQNLTRSKQIVDQIKPHMTSVLRYQEYYSRNDIPAKLAENKATFDSHKKEIEKLLNSKHEIEQKLHNLKNQKQDIEKKDRDLSSEIDKTSGRLIQIEANTPANVLEGKVDFSKAEELENKIRALEVQIEQYENELSKIRDQQFKATTKSAEYQHELNNKRDILKNLEIQEREFISEYNIYYEGLPQAMDLRTNRDSFMKAKTEYQMILDQLCQKYSKKIPPEKNFHSTYNRFLTLLHQSPETIEQLDDQLIKLEGELKKFEDEIRRLLSGFKNNIIQNVREANLQCRELNHKIGEVHFGKIRKIEFHLVKRENFKQLKNISVHQSLFSEYNFSIDHFFRDLAQKLGFRTGSPAPDEILDYRNYFDIVIRIIDVHGNEREKGLSTGENLGTNLVLVLALLKNLSSETNDRFGAVPILLDEADRLDKDALNTIFELTKRFHFQIIIAVPNVHRFEYGLNYQFKSTDKGVVNPYVWHKK